MKKYVMLLFVLLPFMTIIGQEDTPSFCVGVWYPSSEHPGGYDSLMGNLETINVVHPFWYTPMPDGSIQATDDEDDAKLAEWREADVLILPSIFSSIFNMLETEETRAAHITAVLDLVEEKDYDGIDIDYEGFPPETRENFSLFIETLSDELHQRGKLLSIAVHAKTADSAGSAQDWERIGTAVDIFNIMTYDYTNRNEPPGPIAPLAWTLEVLAYAETTVDLSKVRVGLPFYGYSWTRGNPPATTVAWEGINRWVTSFDIDVQRTDDMAAFAEIRARGLPRQEVYYADAVGLRFKMEQIITAYPTLGGVAIWGTGGEDPENWSVLRELRPASCLYQD